MNYTYRILRTAALTMCCGLGTIAYGQSANALLHAFNKTISNQDPVSLQGHISDQFSVAGHTQEGAQRYLKHMLLSYPIKDATLITDSLAGSQRTLRFNYINTAGDKLESSIHCTADYKLLYVDLFDRLYGMKREQKSTLKAVIPFENQHGSIILQVKINNHDRPIRMLFDTGADGLAVSQTLADEIGIKANKQNQASVVGGNVQIAVSEGHQIQLDSLQLKNQSVAIFPKMAKGVDGIIGNILLRRFITSVDYDKSELRLYTFGTHDYPSVGHILPITMPSSTVIIQGQLEPQKGILHDGRFVFDTGAAYSLICFRPFVRDNRLLVNGFKSEYQGVTNSLGTMSQTHSGRATSFSMRGMPPIEQLYYTLMVGSAQNEQWQPPFAGSVGTRIISKYNFTVNLASHELHMQPNRLSSVSTDFRIGPYLFGFANDGRLVVLSIVSGDPKQATLQVDDEVLSIADIPSTKLFQQSKAVQRLLDKYKDKEVSVKFNRAGLIKQVLI